VGRLSSRSEHDDIADARCWMHIAPMQGQWSPIALSVSLLLLAGCDTRSAPAGEQVTKGAASGESIVTVNAAPYAWRNDPDCYVAGTQLASDNPLANVADVQWRPASEFRGYLMTNFEGWNFVTAERREDPRALDERRYQAEIYAPATQIPFAPEPRTYWIEFTGREARCNSQRPGDASIELPSSQNLVRIDAIKVHERVR